MWTACAGATIWWIIFPMFTVSSAKQKVKITPSKFTITVYHIMCWEDELLESIIMFFFLVALRVAHSDLFVWFFFLISDKNVFSQCHFAICIIFLGPWSSTIFEFGSLEFYIMVKETGTWMITIQRKCKIFRDMWLEAYWSISNWQDWCVLSSCTKTMRCWHQHPGSIPELLCHEATHQQENFFPVICQVFRDQILTQPHASEPQCFNLAKPILLAISISRFKEFNSLLEL